MMMPTKPRTATIANMSPTTIPIIAPLLRELSVVVGKQAVSAKEVTCTRQDGFTRKGIPSVGIAGFSSTHALNTPTALGCALSEGRL